MSLFKNKFNYEELIACAKGKLIGLDFPKLPLPPMLMFDKILNISENGGNYNKGSAHAEFNITPDKWFFECHFKDDPVMPGCLGMDGLWQLLGFVLASWEEEEKEEHYLLGMLSFQGKYYLYQKS